MTCNRGIGGEVCAELLERLPGTLQELRPGAIVLSLAANDFLQRDADAANIPFASGKRSSTGSLHRLPASRPW
ncbi:MAG: hypothetical protein R3F17_16765 [Planctomycetota bacterium]